MPYLPIDPKDVGRSYEAVIRVNSQSGKGGIAYLLETEYGLELPRRLQIEFSQVVQQVMDASGTEQTASDIWGIFQREYGIDDVRVRPQVVQEEAGQVSMQAQVGYGGRTLEVNGRGNGPIDAFCQGLSRHAGEPVQVLGYHEHSVGAGANALAVAYLELRIGERALFGVGQDANIVTASLKAIVSGLRRAGIVLAEAAHAAG
jgi:2-isopropylmalate synthase